MRVKLRLFAMYKETVGRGELEISVAEGATANDVLERLVRDYPSLSGLVGATMFAIDEEFVPGDTVLRDGQQVALLPPVSGG